VERNVDAARKLSIGPRFDFRFAIENRARAGPINKSRECNRRSSRCFSVFTIKFARPRGAGRLAELLTLALAYSLQRRSLSCFAARVLTLFRFVLGTKQRARARARALRFALFSLASSGLRFPYRSMIDSTFDLARSIEKESAYPGKEDTRRSTRGIWEIETDLHRGTRNVERLLNFETLIP